MDFENYERRVVTGEIRVAKDEKIRGYGAIFGSLSQNLGNFVEIINPGAFANALKISDVRALINHDPSLILGRNIAGTLVLNEDEVGLSYEIDPPNTQYARDLLESLRRGDISQSSFGFTVARDEWQPPTEERPLLRIIHEIKELFDVSPVTFPAYEGTVVGVRAMDMISDLSRAAQFNDGAAGRLTRLNKLKLQLKKREIL